MRSYTEMNDAPPVVCQDQEDIQDLEPESRHGEKVDRDHAFHMVLQEGPPRLRWRLPPVYHVLAHAGFADINAEFEEFAMNSGSSPKRILSAQPPDQISYFWRDPWAARLAVTNFPGPEESKAFAMARQ
jgi:hypothetical protein